jgi:hypothetical protein
MTDNASEQGPRRELVLEIRNHHYDCCGIPPTFDPDKGLLCYFENCYGEQNVLQWDREEKKCHLRMADVGWEEPLEVVEFRDRVLVRFVRSTEERRKEFKMNRQFEGHNQPESEKDPWVVDMCRKLRQAIRKGWGEPLLTDKEVEYVLNCPTISKDEYAVCKAFFLSCMPRVV